MKKALIAVGALLSATASFAQEPKHQSYNVSPFHSEVRLGTTSTQTLQAVQAHLPGWQVAADRQSGRPRDLYGPALAIPGTDLSAKADYLFANALSAMGLQPADWQLASATTAPRATYRRYNQKVGGREVVFSRLDLRFTTAGLLQRIVMRHFGQPNAALVPLVSAADALTAGTTGLPAGSAISTTTEGTDWAWFPVPSENGYSLHPAWPFKVEGVGADRVPFILTGYVDALDGKLLYRTNEVQTDADLTVKGTVHTQNAVTPPTLVPLKNLEVTIGGVNYNTDTGGYVNAPGLTLPQTATVKLRGLWSVVRNAPTSNSVPTFPTPITALGGTYIFPDTTPSSIRHINAYYHTDSIHGFMKRYLPSFTGLDVALQTNVDVAGTCNAFYNGTSINFFPSGGGCLSTALMREVVYHEYGHGINGRFYQSQGTTFQNGAMNEGHADVWAMCITGDPVVGKGFFATPTSSLRRYDGAPKVYPTNIVGEVHDDGEIIAGAWWDTYVNIGSLDTMTQIFSESYYDLPNGPNGTEGEVFHEVLIAALMADDNDGNIINGTPHFIAITSAFARHGIYLLSDAKLEHTEIPHPAVGAPIPVTATLTLTQPAFFSALKVFFRSRGTTTWDSLTMTNSGGNVWGATIPGQSANTFLEYYFAVYDQATSAPNAIFPAFFRPAAPGSSASNIVYQAGVGILPVVVQNFNTIPAAGWSVGNNTGDNATTGIWIQAVPVGSFLNTAAGAIAVQPGADHTEGAGGACLVTGNAPNTSSAINTADVDDGITTAISPFYSLSGYANPVLEYWRWYSNDRGTNPRNDFWRVQMRRTATSSWISSVDYTNAPDASWRRRIFAINQVLSGADSIQIRFVVQDLAGTPSTVEGAVDDVVLYDDASLAVKDVARNTVSVFPNPANDVLTVVLERGEEGTMSLSNATGQVVMKQSTSRGQNRYSLATRSLAAGLYVLIVRGENGVQTTHKVSVQR